MGRLIFMIAGCLATFAAEAETLTCTGIDPKWTARIDGAVGTFEITRSEPMTIPLVTRAERREWPRAFTLLGERDTAIVIVDRNACELGSNTLQHSAVVLTQRGTTAIMLTGCCAVETE